MLIKLLNRFTKKRTWCASYGCARNPFMYSHSGIMSLFSVILYTADVANHRSFARYLFTIVLKFVNSSHTNRYLAYKKFSQMSLDSYVNVRFKFTMAPIVGLIKTILDSPFLIFTLATLSRRNVAISWRNLKSRTDFDIKNHSIPLSVSFRSRVRQGRIYSLSWNHFGYPLLL